MSPYTAEEDKQLNAELQKLQKRASRLILSDKWDHVSGDISDLQLSILTAITNAESHHDINPYMWNTGVMSATLDTIEGMMKKVRIKHK